MKDGQVESVKMAEKAKKEVRDAMWKKETERLREERKREIEKDRERRRELEKAGER